MLEGVLVEITTQFWGVNKQSGKRLTFVRGGGIESPRLFEEKKASLWMQISA